MAPLSLPRFRHRTRPTLTALLAATLLAAPLLGAGTTAALPAPIEHADLRDLTDLAEIDDTFLPELAEVDLCRLSRLLCTGLPEVEPETPVLPPGLPPVKPVCLDRLTPLVGIDACVEVPPVKPPVLPPVLPPTGPENPCPWFDDGKGGHAEKPGGVLCPDLYHQAACAGAGLVVMARTGMLPQTVAAEGLSRASASAYAWNGWASSHSASSGALADVSALGLASATAVGSDCSAQAWVSGGWKGTYATAHAEAAEAWLLGLVRARVLTDDSTVSNGGVVSPTQGDLVELCTWTSGCTTYSSTVNQVVPVAPGVYAVLNERGTAPYPGGATLTWGAALHLVVEPLGPNPGLDVYVAYTAAAA